MSAALAAASTKMLSVGSGDGSQQAAIVRRGHRNIVVTFFDTRAEVMRKYPSAMEHLAFLDSAGVEQHFGVDAASLGSSAVKALNSSYDVVFFYFPHVGGNTSEASVLAANRKLVREYLCAAVKVLKRGGNMHLALKTGGAYDKWNVTNLFQDGQLRVTQEKPVDKTQFPGYIHRLTKGATGSSKSVIDNGTKLFILEPAAADDLKKLDAQVFLTWPAPLSSDELAERENTLKQQHASELEKERRRVATEFETIYAERRNMSLHDKKDAEAIPSQKEKGVTLTDADLEVRICEALRTTSGGLTVLDLRRMIKADSLPPVPSMNRVLYMLETRRLLHRGPPLSNGRKSQKPTWSLISSGNKEGGSTTAATHMKRKNEWI